jgi:hypothetical protein
MTIHEGGCLCGAIRYETLKEPIRVAICHCRFCQRATGSAYMVEPVFQDIDFRLTRGALATYQQRSEGSGKMVTIHFCQVCGTRIFLGLERAPDIRGVYAGTFDDPDWFAITLDNSYHLFLESARHDSIIPQGVRAFAQHRQLVDGTPTVPTVFDLPHTIGRR